MARPKLDERVRKARLDKARKEAARLNRKLPKPHLYACATESGKVVVYFEPPSLPKVRIRSQYPSLEFDAELLAAKRGEPLRVGQPRASNPPASTSPQKHP